MKSELQKSPQYIKGVGPKRRALLERLGVGTVAELLYYFPRDYQDRTKIVPIAELKHGMRATLKGEITACRVRKMRNFRKFLSVVVTDTTGALEARWYNQPYLEPQFAQGGTAYLTGKVAERRGKLTMANPEFEVVSLFDMDEESEEAELLGIVPIYPLTEGLKQFQLRRITRNALDTYAREVDEVIPTKLLESGKLPKIHQALADIHFPATLGAAEAAHRRFVYEEFLLLECAMAMRRASIQKEPCPYQIKVSEKIDEHIRALLEFDLTEDQEKVVVEIAADLAKPHPMNRLLQGDVGSGKTVVALYAMLSAVANHFQVVMMAPTEILATQHHETFRGYLAKSRVRMELLIGGLSAAARKDSRARIAAGEVDIVFGTHALIEEDVEFKDLALLVVDEPHKFGVVQRAKLREKGRHPHCLVMTATPIPRTLMLTVFGDLDVSTIEHLPPGRKPIETSRVAPGQISTVFDLIRTEVAAGRQAFIVYPLVEESDALDLKAATAMHKRLSRREFPDLNVGNIA